MDGLPPLPFNQLVEAVIHQESKGNPNAVSPVGAAGLMQIMPDTAAQPGYGVRPMDWDNRFNAEENRRFGTDYLAALLGSYDGDQERALVAYNWGPGNANSWDGDIANLPAETRDYLAKVLGSSAPATSLRPQLRPEILPQMLSAPVSPATAPPVFQTPTAPQKARVSAQPAFTDLINAAALQTAEVAAADAQLAMLPR